MQNAESLTKMKKDELVALCKQYGITGYSKLKKDELVAAIIAASASDSSCTEECTTTPAPAPAKKTCKTKSAKVAAAQTAKTADGIGDYCTALVNLWGIAPVEQVMQAYNYLCDATVTADEVAAAAKDAGYTIVGNELIHSRIADNEEELSTLRARKKLYPYYLPAKEDISTYLDESFRENSHAFLAMTGFFHRSMKLEEAVAAELTSKILSYLNSGTPLSALMNDLRERSVSFEDDEQFRNFAVLLDSLKNAARLWAFNGHTPTEAKAFEPAPEKKVPVRVIKVGRNDACPCGSGKKYKKCCGR